VYRKKFEYRTNPAGTARHELPIGTTSTHTKETTLKMHLVMTAAFVGLCSHAAFAAGEGGESDTWSRLEPKAFTRSTQALTIATTKSSTSPQGFPVPARVAGGEGGDGDTWSAVQDLASAPSTRSPVVATTAPLSSLQREYTSAYGTPAQRDSANRIVHLSPSLHSIDVANGETVTFIVDAQNGSQRSFAWRFDVSPVLSHVDLSEVAPADLSVQNVRVFVAPDSRYRGG
jgi:hypothetical protein